MTFLLNILAGVAIQIIGFLLIPKPKPAPLPELEDLQNPTAEAGRPIPHARGTQTIKSANCIFFGDKQIRHRKVRA